MRRILLVALALCACTVALFAQRLPETAVPSHYQLKFTPNFQNNTFEGSEVIDVRLPKPMSTITLNALEIDFHSVTITAAGKTQKAKVALDPKDEMATLSVPQAIPAGPAHIAIEYTGKLNDKLRGLYLSQTKERKYAVTQFESTDARRAFPSFDEPAFKATFDITTVIDKDDTAISNGTIVSDKPGPGADKHTVRFSTTPKMSTYLVALAIGDWKCLSGEEDGIPLRVCTVPGKEQYAKWALESTKHILHFYDTYYGIKYPYAKLDQIAVPDFEAGAMENTACIIYRETDFLADEKTASIPEKANISEVIAHEMAHQWFGDLVTMKWWDDIWLNEGFATWMEDKPVEAWHPDWNINLQEVQNTSNTMNYDSVVATRPIRQNAITRGQINALFDGIAYGKSAAVLNMLESYLGPEVFRQGVNNYLKAHAYGNATASDFWNAMTAASHKPINKLMPTFVEQPGVPYVGVHAQCNGDSTTVTLSQKRYFLDPALFAKGANQLWQIPVCLKSIGADGKTLAQKCEVLTKKSEQFALPGCAAWVYPNAGAMGYYRYGYEPAALNRLHHGLETVLTPAERVSMVGDEWALVRAGSEHVSNYLALVQSLRNDRTPAVVSEIINEFGDINRVMINKSDRPQFEAFVRSYLQPIMKELGMEPKPNEGPEAKPIRAAIFAALGNIGEDPAVIAKANELTKSYMANAASVDPSLARAAIAVAAAHGNEQLYDAFLQHMKTSKDPQEYYNYFYALAGFRVPSLLERTMEWTLTPAVRNQDLYVLGRLIGSPYAGNQGWEFVKSHYTQIKNKVSVGGLGFLMGGTSAYCDAGLRDDVKKFFTEHPQQGLSRELQRSQESINYCIEMRQRESQPLAKWLAGNMSQQTGQ